jgi:uncharacterized protein
MRIYIQALPRSSKNEVLKIAKGEYKIKLNVPPVDGQANRALIRILSDYFAVPSSLIKIVGGQSARIKIVDVQK